MIIDALVKIRLCREFPVLTKALPHKAAMNEIYRGFKWLAFSLNGHFYSLIDALVSSMPDFRPDGAGKPIYIRGHGVFWVRISPLCFNSGSSTWLCPQE